MEKLKKYDLVVPYLPAGEGMPVEVKIEKVNWPGSYPYAPEVKARLWHDGDNLHIEYEVDEEYVAALAEKDNGEVWKDSCVEFFVSLDGNGYYNLESNCTGKVLLSHRLGRKDNVEYASEDVLKGIKRDPSLGSSPFAVRKSEGKWTLKLVVPATTFFKTGIESFKGIDAKCNIYKCGDELPVPHFLSLFPIKTENPDFHRPEFFGTAHFE